MRKISQRQKVLGIAMVLVVLVVGFLGVGVSEGQRIPIFNRDVVLVDCVENGNGFMVGNVSSTRDEGISQGMDCAVAVQKLFSTGFVLGPGTGGVTSSDPTSLTHFMMLFVLNSNSLIEPVSPTSSLNPSGDCAFRQNFGECSPNLERPQPLSPILNLPQPLSPIVNSPQPLTPILQSPILQRRNP